MRTVTIHEPLATRICIVRDGRPIGGLLEALRQRTGEALQVTAILEPEGQDGPRERVTLPASQVWVDTAWQQKWADAQTSYELAEGLRRKAEDKQQRCTCGHTRRAHHVGGVDDGGCTACECPAYTDELGSLRSQVSTLTHERDKARDELDGIAEVLDAAGVPQVTDGPDGRRWTLGPGARVEHVIAERDEARAEVERLRAVARLGEGE